MASWLKRLRGRDQSESPSRRAQVVDMVTLARLLRGDAKEPDAESIVREAYEKNPEVFSALLRIVTASQSVPWIVQLDGPASSRRGRHLRAPREAPSTHAASRLLTDPNPLHSWDYIVEHMVGNILLFGNGVCVFNGPNDTAPPTELLPVTWSRVRLEEDAGGFPRVYHVRQVDGSERPYPADRVWHAYGWHPRSISRGQSRAGPAARDIDLSNEMRRWNANLSRNLAQPPGAFRTDRGLDEVQYQRMKKQVDEEYAGADNAGRPLLLEEGLDWVRTGFSPNEMDWNKSLLSVRRVIAVAMGVAPELLGDPETKTYANALEARLALYEDAVVPILKVLRSSLLKRLRQWWPTVDVHLDVDSTPAMQERRRAYAATLQGLVDRGIITRNEAREELGWPKARHADTLLAPMSIVPLETLVEVDDEESGDTDENDPGEGDDDADEDDAPAAQPPLDAARRSGRRIGPRR